MRDRTALLEALLRRRILILDGAMGTMRAGRLVESGKVECEKADIRPPGDGDLLEILGQSIPQRMVLNLGDVPYMDSSAIAVLVEALQKVRRGGGKIYLCNLQPRVKGLLEIARLELPAAQPSRPILPGRTLLFVRRAEGGVVLDGWIAVDELTKGRKTGALTAIELGGQELEAHGLEGRRGLLQPAPAAGHGRFGIGLDGAEQLSVDHAVERGRSLLLRLPAWIPATGRTRARSITELVVRSPDQARSLVSRSLFWARRARRPAASEASVIRSSLDRGDR